MHVSVSVSVSMSVSVSVFVSVSVSVCVGTRGLYRGCALTVGRAAPSNAVLFTAYEMTM